MRITDEYRKLNQQMHESNENYGTIGKMHAPRVMDLAFSLKTQDVLDYGCGKAKLSQNLPFKIQNYDPCIPKYSKEPMPADIVVCSDVLEHVEPDCLDEVLAHLASLTKAVCLLQVPNGPAKKTLADGRNAHLIQEDYVWWMDKLKKHMKIVNFQLDDTPMNNGAPVNLGYHFEEYIILCRPYRRVEV